MKNALREIENLIRKGDASQARIALRQVVKGRVPRRERLQVATLARRLNLPDVSVRLLNRLVRPPNGRPCEASELEIAEYAASLMRLGAVGEALGLLEKLNVILNPEVLLFRSFALFTQWNYRQSIGLLEKYIQSDITPYQKAVGTANLAAALSYERRPNASTVIEELLEVCKKNDYHLLIGHLVMMQAEAEIVGGNWEQAKRLLEQSAGSLDHPGTLEALFVEKWKVICDLYRRNDPQDVLRLNTVRDSATEMRHWETLRHCDHHECVARKDYGVFSRVWVGTPYLSLKGRLESETGFAPPTEEKYLWDFFAREKPKREIALFQEGKFKTGSLSLRILTILCSDFYRPRSVAALHAALFEGEFFNPDSSPGRVHQAVRRVRAQLRSHSLPVEVVESHGFYSLRPVGPVGVWVPTQRSPSRMGDLRFSKLEEVFSQSSFTAEEAGRCLGVSVWTAIRLMKEGVEKGLILRLGKGKNTRYQFNSSQKLVA